MVAQSVSRSDMRPNAAIAQLLYSLSAATTVLLLLLAAWSLVRRVTEQLQPLSVLAMIMVATTLAGVTSLLRIGWFGSGAIRRPRKARSAVIWAIPSVVVLMFAASLSIAGTGSVRLFLFWAFLLGADGAWWWFFWRQLRPSAQREATGANTPVATAPAPSVVVEESAVEGDDDPLSDDVSQQITRSWAEDDRDTMTGVLRARFQPGERSQSLHVPLCPPMLRRPKVTVVQLSGSRARIKAADVQTFGIRFDLRLATPDDEMQDVLIHFEACCGKPASAGLGGITP